MPATEAFRPENDEPTAKRAKTDAPDETSDTPSGTAGAAAGGTGAASDQLAAAIDWAAGGSMQLRPAATEQPPARQLPARGQPTKGLQLQP